MKLREGFITYETDGEQFMVAAGEAIHIFRGLIRSNETAGFIVNCLKQETTEEKIVDKMAAEYNAPKSVISKDVRELVDKLRMIGALDE